MDPVHFVIDNAAEQISKSLQFALNEVLLKPRACECEWNYTLFTVFGVFAPI